ncbi:AraC family transcriptional regulator [Maricurvus nonylphenolicus]|uniref:helix-turn-helix domain-containing protein n=1 Tax=Maricurvus nonylphenolicus TaxID=1008307 RepID=UPI0036F40765
MSSTPAQEIRLSAANPLILLDLLKEKGFSEEQIFADIDLSPHSIQGVDSQMTYSQSRALICKAITLTHNPSIGLEFGRRINITGSGMFGLGVLACNTIAESLHLASRATAALNPAVHFKISNDEKNYYLDIEEVYPWEGAARVMVETCFSMMQATAETIFPEHADRVHYEMTYEPHLDKSHYEKYLAGHISFNANHNRVILPIDICQKNLPFSNNRILEQTENWLQRTIEDLHNNHKSLLIPIRNIMEDNLEKVPGMDEIAEILHMSSRTLNRRLKEMGTNYKELISDVRKNKAMELLTNPNYSVDEVAYSLGYSNASNFTKAFKLWTGNTPSVYRKEYLIKN